MKLRVQLPHTWCSLVEPYLTERQSGFKRKESTTNWKNIAAQQIAIPQGSVL